jgi:hypothetical protein
MTLNGVGRPPAEWRPMSALHRHRVLSDAVGFEAAT